MALTADSRKCTFRATNASVAVVRAAATSRSVFVVTADRRNVEGCAVPERVRPRRCDYPARDMREGP